MIGFAVGSGAALLAPILGLTSATTIGGKIVSGAISGSGTGLVTNALTQGTDIATGKQSEWDNQAFALSGLAGIFAGSASAGMGSISDNFMKKIGDKMFKDFTKSELKQYAIIQTTYLKKNLERITGAKVSQRGLTRELNKAMKNWSDIKASEIEAIQFSTVKSTKVSSEISVTIGVTKILEQDKNK